MSNIDLIKQAAIKVNDQELYNLAIVLEKEAGTEQVVKGGVDLAKGIVGGFKKVLGRTGEMITQKTVAPGVTAFRSSFFKRLARPI